MPDGNFYGVGDSTKIKDFVLVPKALFTDARYRGLAIRGKLAYSFYLRRFRGTSYKDRQGDPYIIYTDAELAQNIDTAEHYVSDIKAVLKRLGLISTCRTTRGDAIKVYSCNRQGQASHDFFSEADLEEWRFYRFPTELLRTEYSLLDINIRMYYAFLFDMLCLSQANYMADDFGRVYFQLSVAEQGKRFNLSPNTVKKYKNYLQACGLLNEYRPFGNTSHYYLMHLSCYKPNADRFYNMTDPERNDWIKQINDDFKKKQIDPMNTRLQSKEKLKQYKQCLKGLKLNYEDTAKMITSVTHQDVSRASLSKYLNGARTMPDHVKGCLDLLLDKGHLDADMLTQHETAHYILPAMSGPDTEEPESFSQTEYVLDKCTSYLRSCSILKQEDIEMLCDVVQSFAHTETVTIRDDGTSAEISQSEIIDLLDASFVGQEAGLIKIINGLNRSSANKDFNRAMAYLRTSIVSMLHHYQKHPWFRSQGASQMDVDIYRATKESAADQFSDEVKNFKLFG